MMRAWVLARDGIERPVKAGWLLRSSTTGSRDRYVTMFGQA